MATYTLVGNKYTGKNVYNIFECSLIEDVRPVLRARRGATAGAASVSRAEPDVLLPPRQHLLQLRAADALQNSEGAIPT